MSDRISEDMPEKMPEDMPDRMPEDLPDRMPEDMPEHMPDRMPEDMSDRMPEDLPGRKCINVMVGIIRSEVISCFFPKIGYLQIARLMITVFSLYCHFGVSIFRHTQKRVQKMLQEGGGSYNPTYLQFGRSS